ncbi:MAG TPA: hypothetical protein VGA36_06460 [Nitriliruptorales bacterium]
MRTYEVTATRNDGWWTLTVKDVPGAISQVRRLDQAEAWMREAIALVLDVDQHGFDVRIVAEMPGVRGRHLAELVDRRRHAAAELDAVHRDQELAVAALRDEGLTMRDIATLLDLSHQRVAQIAKG